MDNRGSVFDAFHKRTPKNIDTTAQMLFDYEEHYMRLVKSYRGEFGFAGCGDEQGGGST